MRQTIAVLGICASLSAVHGHAQQGAASDAVTTYTAVYDVHYKGRRVGTSEFSVRPGDAEGHYVYRSQTRVKGLLRLLSPNPAVDQSEFLIDSDGITPLSFYYEDGSRKGEDNFRVAFDWPAGTATLTGENGTQTIPLRPGVLDRGSLQVAVMRALANDRVPGPYELIDDDGLETYEYMEQEPAAAETGMGLIETRRFVQQREGSSRSTVLWTAPSLQHVPVRIEQIRDGAAETVFVLDTLELDSER